MKTRFLATLSVILIPLAANGVEPALGGNCPVCLVEIAKIVPGSDKHTVTFDRQTYYFPSARERMMFDADPASFVAKDMKLGAAPAGISVTGKTWCAGCAYGVRPITDSEILGIAVVNGGTVYVVEGGEKSYPELFNARTVGAKTNR